MAISYASSAIADSAVPRAAAPVFQHLIDTYASETNKTISTWGRFSADDLTFRPHTRSSTVGDIFKHQLLSERRFFGEFLGLPEPPADTILPEGQTPADYSARMLELAIPRLGFLASRDGDWWLEESPFFDVRRQRIWIFWRRVLHSAHHRTQLTVYLRLLDKPVPSTYGPTADVTWTGSRPDAERGSSPARITFLLHVSIRGCERRFAVKLLPILTRSHDIASAPVSYNPSPLVSQVCRFG